MIFFKSVNIWQSYKQERGCLMYFARLANTLLKDDTIRYDTRCYFNVRSKADISQLNLPHGTDN